MRISDWSSDVCSSDLVADQIKKLDVPGIHQQPETRRYYPDGEVTAHLVGFTSVEDKGQEGVELAFNDLLSGTPGSRRVIKDRLGRVIEDVQAVTLPVNGRDLNLSIDARLQYLVFRELNQALQKHQAGAASAIVMDVHTGEILALASLPTFDPNRRETFHAPNLRNRAITDRSEEHTSELQSLMRISYAVFCLKKKKSIFTKQSHTNS